MDLAGHKRTPGHTVILIKYFFRSTKHIRIFVKWSDLRWTSPRIREKETESILLKTFKWAVDVAQW